DEINTVIVEERRPVMSSTQIGNVNAETLLLWSNRATSSADKRFLERVAGLMRTRNDAQVTIAKLDEERQELISEQRRVADLIKTVPNLDELRTRYLTTLSQTEDRLEEVSREKEAAEGDLNAVTKQIQALLK
ncbi:MAG: hypothetical protein ABJN42_12320, partial [Roseibium sp.]|uniref:hypothetical protein n=1 Tax=Roseibium sp. TaxID=1936156 RepID=UPI003297D713